MPTSSTRLAGVMVAMAMALAACGPKAPDGAENKSGVTVLRYSSPYTPSHPFSQADIAWIKHVEASSKGRLKIEPYWGGTLVGSDNAVLELAHGVADIALVTPIYSRAGMTAIKTQAGFYAGAATPAEQVAVYQCLQKSFPVLDAEMAGVKVLALQGGNLPNVLTRGKPVLTLAAFKGLRLRTPSEVAPLLRQLGADPVTMPMAEVYSSLSKGVIDGVLAPADTLQTLHFSEVASHLSQFSVPRGAYPARAISERSWARLPPDLQAILASSQGLWQDELNTRMMKAETDGAAFGQAHGEQFHKPGPAEEAAFIGLYDRASLAQAKKASTASFDGPAMFAAAHAATANIRAGRPAC
jgi:TRAP-type C4-dicarboxylate transport system substrate-binding protein